MAENSAPQDLYALLGVSADASRAQIKAAYHRLAKLHHPDKKSASDQDSSQFRKVHDAYETLYNEDLRAKYDQELTQKADHASSPPLNVFNPRPFNIFNPRRSQSSSNADFYDTANHFVQEDPQFANKNKYKGPFPDGSWKNPYTAHARAESSPLRLPEAHGVSVRMTGHPAATEAKKCTYNTSQWRKGTGTEICIFCMRPWERALGCPVCQAVACPRCVDEINKKAAKPPEWYWPHAGQHFPSGG